MRNAAGALVILDRLCFSSPCITPVSLALYVRCKCLVYNKYVKRGCKAEEWEHVKTLRQNTSQMITSAKEKYSQKLSDPANGVKAY